MNILYKFLIKLSAYRIRDKEERLIWRFNKLHGDVCWRYPGHSYAMQPASINAKIGKFVSIGKNSLIGAGMHPLDYISTHPCFYNEEINAKNSPVIIGNDVWIGQNVFIKPGVKIGNGAVIGINSVVTKDVPDYAIVGGAPAKFIRYRFSEKIIKELLASKWWEFSLEEITKLSYKEPEKFLEELKSKRKEK